MVISSCTIHSYEEKLELDESRILSDSIVPINDIMDIQQWGCDKHGNLIVISDLTDTCVRIIDLNCYKICDKYIPRGEGPGEAKSLTLASNKKDFILIDNFKMKIFSLNPCRSEKRLNDYGLIYNQPSLWHYPFVSSIDKSNAGKIWRLINIETSETVDSIIIEKNHEPYIFDKISDYSQCISDNYFVLAGKQINCLIIGHLIGNCHIGNIIKLYGKEESKSEYYTTVDYDDNLIYLLSQKKVELNQSGEIYGQSEIEIYDNHGNPIDRIQLDYVATKMLVIPQIKKILLLSVDDTIRMIDCVDNS